MPTSELERTAGFPAPSAESADLRKTPSVETMDRSSDQWLRDGFVAAVAISVLGFIAVFAYLSFYAYETNASFSGETGEGKALGHSVRINHMAPGTLVILASTVLISICATHKSELQVRPSSVTAGSSSPSPANQAQGGQAPTAPAMSDRNQAAGTPASVCIPDPTINKTCPVREGTGK